MMKLKPRIETRLGEMIESLYEKTYDQEGADRYYREVKKTGVTQTFNFNQFHILSYNECVMVAFMRMRSRLGFWNRILLKLYAQKLYK